MKSTNYVIFGHSDIAGGMRPTAHGTFPDYVSAHRHATASMKETKFKILSEKEAAQAMEDTHHV